MNSDSRNQLEKALHDAHRSQSLLDATIKSTVSGVVVCDLDVNFVLVNPAARKLLGKMAELGPEHWNESLGLFESEHGRLFEDHELPLRRACGGEAVMQMELLARNGVDKEPIWLEANATQILGLDNKPLGAVTVFNDVTLQRKSLEGLRNLQEQTQSKLAASNKQLDEVLNTIPEAIWRGVHTDNGFEFTYFSPGIEGITGFSPTQLTDGTETFDNLVHVEDRDRIKRLAKQILAGVVKNAEIEYRLQHADGSVRWVLNRIRTVVASEPLLTVQGIVSDITNERETSAALMRAERLTSIGTLAAGIAHEINNPLAAIMLTAELAKTRMDMGNLSNEQLDEVFTDIKQQVESCAKIVKGVLMFANNETTERSVISIHAIAVEANKLIKFEANKRRIDIQVRDVEGEEPLANANETEIVQVVVSLLANAMDASPDEAGIEVSIWTNRDRVICSVVDAGSGMSAEEQRSAFDPFYTSKRTSGGTGLGLSMSHSIIAKHGGEIWIESSELGTGTTFNFSLPKATEQVY